MELQKGDWARTEKGAIGNVVLINRETAFIELMSAQEGATIIGFLKSQLTKVDPPEKQSASP
jgi:hypothetical protein